MSRSRFALFNRITEKFSKGEAVSLSSDGRLLASDGSKMVVIDIDGLEDFRDKKFVVTQILAIQQDICQRYVQDEAEKAQKFLEAQQAKKQQEAAMRMATPPIELVPAK